MDLISLLSETTAGQSCLALSKSSKTLAQQIHICRMDDEGGPVTVSYGRRESFVLADDMSDFFGTQHSIDGESYRYVQSCVLS